MEKITKKKSLTLMIYSILFGGGCAIGSYVEHHYGRLLLLCVFVIETILMYTLVSYMYKWVRKGVMLPVYSHKENAMINFFKKNAWMKCFLCILGIWIPLVIARWPGIMGGGVTNQFKQIMGMDTLARQLSPVIYEGSYISGHHPVLLTYVFGAFIKFGILVGEPNIGLFLLSCFVCLINALCWSFVLSTVKKYLNNLIWNILFLIFLLNPMIISFNTYVLKDNLFASVLAVYSILIFKLLRDREKKDMFLFFFISVILPFVKNQGIYIVILTSFLLMIVEYKHMKYWLCCLITSILIFSVLFQGLLMPVLKVSPGGKQEMFSVFFQTTARTIIENEEIIGSEEYSVIQRVLPIDDWSEYNPTLSDPIKFQYNQNASSADLMNYFKVWIKHGLEYPQSYLKAIFHQTYGYYYVDFKTTDWIFGEYGNAVTDSEDFIDAPQYKKVIEHIDNFLYSCQKNGRWKYLFSVPVAFWIITMCCILYDGKIKNMLWISPILLQWLICLGAPVNGSGRYGMIIYEMVPFVISWMLSNEQVNPELGKESNVGNRL